MYVSSKSAAWCSNAIVVIRPDWIFAGRGGALCLDGNTPSRGFMKLVQPSIICSMHGMTPIGGKPQRFTMGFKSPSLGFMFRLNSG